MGESQKKICLTMIVKNEGEIIERCLNSVKDFVDSIVVCDTGSTDNTVKIIEDFFKRNNILGAVIKHQWKNFGHNRTLSVETAKKFLTEHQFCLAETYLLFLDADMLLQVNPSFAKDLLIDDSYLVVQKSCAYTFYNLRLARASLPWRSVGVTHEYWTCDQTCKNSMLPSLVIDDRNDGGCKSDKFERDARLLRESLKEEPDNGRYMFYLANTYKTLKMYDDAINLYHTVIQKNGWYEEVWYSKYMLGQCFKEMDNWEMALKYFLEAYQFNPNRAEPLQEISYYYRTNGHHHLAYHFAKQGSSIPYPENEILFISHPVYDYLFDEDISVSAYFTPFKEDGYAATNRLILNKNVPSYMKERAYKNMLYYLPQIKNAHYQQIKLNLPLIREGFAGHYNPMNPSIVKTEDGFDVICRTVNYMQINAQYFKSLDWLDSSEQLNTRNFFVKYDRDLNYLTQQEIVENLSRARVKTRNVYGLEDCRLFHWNQENWFSCTSLDTNPSGQPQISVCKLKKNNPLTDLIIEVEKLIPLPGPDLTKCEKNWLPFIKDNELHMIYSFDPFLIYKPELDVNNGIFLRNSILYHTHSHDFSRFSGSAPPIKFDKGYLTLVHESVYEDRRIYMHRFVYFDSQFRIVKVSKPFMFLHKGIEYCCGMSLDHNHTNLIMTIGLEDREAYFGIVDVNTIRSLLEPI